MCSMEVCVDDLSLVVSPLLLEKFEEMVFQKSLEASPDYQRCPTTGCTNGIFWNEKDGASPTWKCPSCTHIFCLKCKTETEKCTCDFPKMETKNEHPFYFLENIEKNPFQGGGGEDHIFDYLESENFIPEIIPKIPEKIFKIPSRGRKKSEKWKKNPEKIEKNYLLRRMKDRVLKKGN